MALTDITIDAQAVTEEVPCFLTHPENPPCGWVHRQIVEFIYSINGKVVSREDYDSAVARIIEESRGF